MPVAHSSSGDHRSSLERKLPLIMAAVLVLPLLVSLAVIYATLTRSARATAVERLQRAAMQLSEISRSNTEDLKGRLLAVADDSVLRAALVATRTDPMATLPQTRAAIAAANVSLVGLHPPADIGLRVELRDLDGRIVAVGGTGAGTPPPRDRASSSPPARSWPAGLDPPHPGDSVQFGRLYHDGPRTYYWVIAPVRVGGERAGWLLEQHRIGAAAYTSAMPRPDEMVSVLAGRDVHAYFHNADGTVWTTVGGQRAEAPEVRAAPGGMVVRPGVGALYSAGGTVEGTPFALAFERPARPVTEAALASLMRISLVYALLALVGVAIAWVVSRRITGPLVAITDAAESVARGDYEVRVAVAGDDELARLGASFNRMASEVGAARQTLAAQTEEARQAAAELERSNEELGRALGALAEAKSQADAASRAKSDFLAVMSHELRTPLNAIAGFTELLLLGLRGPVTEEQKQDLERIRTNQQHLLGLIGALLDLSRVESGRMAYELESIELGPFLSELASLVAPQSAAKSLELKLVPVEPGLAVRADREKLRQILLNLLSNSIRYTPAGGHITIDTRPADEEAVLVDVTDTGIGISPDELERIFEPFVQIDRSLTRIREGVGLGLPISRDLARGMGGDITVVSHPGKGSVFTLRLPRATAGSREAPPGDEHPAAQPEPAMGDRGA